MMQGLKKLFKEIFERKKVEVLHVTQRIPATLIIK
jgi:hypothetical protein